MVAQIIILALSVIRYVRGEWNGIPIIKLMIRDGTLAFGVLFCELATLASHLAN